MTCIASDYSHVRCPCEKCEAQRRGDWFMGTPVQQQPLASRLRLTRESSDHPNRDIHQYLDMVQRLVGPISLGDCNELLYHLNPGRDVQIVEASMDRTGNRFSTNLIDKVCGRADVSITDSLLKILQEEYRPQAAWLMWCELTAYIFEKRLPVELGMEGAFALFKEFARTAQTSPPVAGFDDAAGAKQGRGAVEVGGHASASGGESPKDNSTNSQPPRRGKGDRLDGHKGGAA